MDRIFDVFVRKFRGGLVVKGHHGYLYQSASSVFLYRKNRVNT